MCRYFIAWTCNFCSPSTQNNSFSRCSLHRPACPNMGLLYPLPAEAQVACWRCGRSWQPPTTFHQNSPTQRPPVLPQAAATQISAFCEMPHGSGREATMLAESRPATYESQRMDVLQQARTRLNISQENGRSTAWENAWLELERSLCGMRKSEQTQARP